MADGNRMSLKGNNAASKTLPLGTTAQQIGITRKEGIAKVVVAPIAVPLPNGNVKLGDAAAANTFLVALNDLRVKHPRVGSEWETSNDIVRR